MRHARIRLRRTLFAVTLSGIVVVVLGAGVSVTRSHTHRHPRSLARVRRPRAPVKPLPHPPRGPSTVEILGVPSVALGQTEPVTVYLPPGYHNPQSPNGDFLRRRYPLLILLQGIPGSVAALAFHTRAIADRLIHEGRIRPLIIAFPPGNRSATDDATEWANGPAPGQGWNTFGTEEAPRAVTIAYPVIANASGVGIGGISAGADGATTAMFDHPDQFASLIAISGSFRQTPATVGNDPALVTAFSALDNVAWAAPILAARRRPVMMEVGRLDSFVTANREMDADLVRAGVSVRYTETPTGHDWATWDAGLASGLVFADASLAH